MTRPCTAPANGTTAVSASWATYFNGQDLDGWQVHGTERWYVEGGELVCESGPDAQYGYLFTEQTYRDFDLWVDFKQEAEKIGAAEGSFALQIHDGGGIKVRWRNLRVVDLGG